MLLAIIQAAYPQFYTKRTDAEMENTVNTWAVLFSRENYKAAEMAATAFIEGDASGYPPSIGQIKNLIKRQKSLDAATTLDPDVAKIVSVWLTMGLGTTEQLRERGIPERYISAAKWRAPQSENATERQTTAPKPAAIPPSPVERRASANSASPLPLPILAQAAYTPPDADEWERLRQVQLAKLRAAGVMPVTT
jgi:hypothetical protein